MRRLSLVGLPIILVLLLASHMNLLAQGYPPTPTPNVNWVQDEVGIRLWGGPGYQYGWIGTVPAGELVQPLGRTQDSHWVLIMYSNLQGWVVADGVSWRLNINALPVIQNGGLQPAPLSINTPWGPTYTPNANWIQVNNQAGFIRSGPGLEYPTLGWMLTGDVVDPVARDESGIWVLIRYNDGYGWIRRDLVIWTLDIETLSMIDDAHLTITPSITPVVSYTPTLTVTPSPTTTPSATATNTDIPTATNTATATNTDIPTATNTATATNTDFPTATDVPTETPQPTATSTNIPTSTATNTDIPTATFEPTQASVAVIPTEPPTNTMQLPTNTVEPPTATTASTITTEPPTSTTVPTATTELATTTAEPPTSIPTETPAAVAMANPELDSSVPPSSEESDDTESSSSLPWLIGGGLALFALLYAGVYFTQSANMDYYQEGFVLATCPVCEEGELHLDERRYRVAGLPRVRRVVRCNNCRSVLRQVGRQRWRYAIDGALNPEMYDQLNGRVLTEKDLLEISSGMSPEYIEGDDVK